MAILNKMKESFKKLAIISIALCLVTSCKSGGDKILVFSKTEEFRHHSIADGIKALEKMGTENGFDVVSTEDARYFSSDSLKKYATVVFLNTSGNILNDAQQAEFEKYIQAGGGFVGVHCATSTEIEWSWYNSLVGAVFDSHPKVQSAVLNVVDSDHPSTSQLAPSWQHEDEWYNFKDINPSIHVLVEIDENSYQGGKHGRSHPISWHHQLNGGRSFYTAMGHTKETYQNPVFLKHLLGGIQYTLGGEK